MTACLRAIALLPSQPIAEPLERRLDLAKRVTALAIIIALLLSALFIGLGSYQLAHPFLGVALFCSLLPLALLCCCLHRHPPLDLQPAS